MLKTLFLLAFISLPAMAQAEIFKYIDANGKLYITDKVLSKPYRLLSVFRPNADDADNAYKNNIRQYMPHIHHAAKTYNLDPNLLHAIIDTESSFNPKAYSKAGAIGLMQLMPETAENLGVKNSWNPKENIEGGALYFRRLLDTFNQNIQLSLAAYNAGEGAVKRAGTIPNYPETKRYVNKVILKYGQLKQRN